MTKGRGFFALMEVTGRPFRDDSISGILDFEDAFWIPWKLTLQLPDDVGIYPTDLPALSWHKSQYRGNWSVRVRQTLVQVDDADSRIIVEALRSAES